jgi:hypothetical protein
MARFPGSPNLSVFRNAGLKCGRIRKWEDDMPRAIKRKIGAVSVALTLAGASAHASRAQAHQMDAMGGMALLGAALVALALVGTVKLVQAATKERPAAPPNSAPTGLAPPPAAPQASADPAETARRAYLARPHCDTVGGYEFYLKSTGNFCRLH